MLRHVMIGNLVVDCLGPLPSQKGTMQAHPDIVTLQHHSPCAFQCSVCLLEDVQ